MRRLALAIPLVLSGCAAVASDPIDHIRLLDGSTLDGDIEGVSDGAFLLRVGDELHRVPLADIDEVERNGSAQLDTVDDLDKARVRPGLNIGLVGASADVEVELDKGAIHSVGARLGVGLGVNGYYIISSVVPQASGFGVFYAQLIPRKTFHIEGLTGPSVLYDPEYSGAFLAWEGGVAGVWDLGEHVGLRLGLVGSTPLLRLTPDVTFSSAYAIGFRPESQLRFHW